MTAIVTRHTMVAQYCLRVNLVGLIALISISPPSSGARAGWQFTSNNNYVNPITIRFWGGDRRSLAADVGGERNAELCMHHIC